MGKRGPKPTPTETLRRRGSAKARERKRRGEVKPKATAPNAPTWLSAEAKAEWKRIVPELDALGLLATIDRGQLAILCDAWAGFRHARKMLEEHGHTVEGSMGQTVPSPWVGILERNRQAYMKAAAKFGLSPTERVGLAPTAKPPAGENPKARRRAEILGRVDASGARAG